MIQHLAIERFKSILSLSLPCRKVNVFIGAPDTGKTNILEALYLLSRLGWGLPLDASLRLSGDVGLEALFYRKFLDRPLQVSLTLDRPPPGLDSTDLRFSARLSGAERILEAELFGVAKARIGFGGSWPLGLLDWLRYYVYSSPQGWQYRTDRLHGTALVAVPVALAIGIGSAMNRGGRIDRALNIVTLSMVAVPESSTWAPSPVTIPTPAATCMAAPRPSSSSSP